MIFRTQKELDAKGVHETEAFADWVERIANVETDAVATDPVEAPDEMLAPPTWDDVIGQTRVRDELEVRVASALNRGASMPHTLLYGPAGSGKSTVARLVAAQLGRQILELPKPPSSAVALIDALAAAECDDGVLFLDEIQLWSPARQADLLELLEEHTLQGPWGSVHYPDLTIVGATTDRHKLSRALRSRFMCTPRWEDYSDVEMAGIATGMAGRAGIEIDEMTAKVMGRASAGSPRATRKLIIAMRDLAQIPGREASARSVLSFTGTEPDGLTLDHLDMLECLATSKEGTAGLDHLGQMMDMPGREINELEVLLTKRRYVGRSGQGRSITPSGRSRLKASR